MTVLSLMCEALRRGCRSDPAPDAARPLPPPDAAAPRLPDGFAPVRPLAAAFALVSGLPRDATAPEPERVCLDGRRCPPAAGWRCGILSVSGMSEVSDSLPKCAISDPSLSDAAASESAAYELLRKSVSDVSSASLACPLLLLPSPALSSPLLLTASLPRTAGCEFAA